VTCTDAGVVLVGASLTTPAISVGVGRSIGLREADRVAGGRDTPAFVVRGAADRAVVAASMFGTVVCVVFVPAATALVTVVSGVSPVE
jgi:hypothetical protein